MQQSKDLILSMENKKYNFQLKKDQNELIEYILWKDDDQKQIRNLI